MRVGNLSSPFNLILLQPARSYNIWAYQDNVVFIAISVILHIEPMTFESSWLAMHMSSNILVAFRIAITCNLKGWHY